GTALPARQAGKAGDCVPTQLHADEENENCHDHSVLAGHPASEQVQRLARPVSECKERTTGVSTPTEAMRTTTSRTPICSPAESPTSAISAAVATVNSMFFGLRAESAKPAPPAFTGVRSSTARIQPGVGDSSPPLGRPSHSLTATPGGPGRG